MIHNTYKKILATAFVVMMPCLMEASGNRNHDREVEHDVPGLGCVVQERVYEGPNRSSREYVYLESADPLALGENYTCDMMAERYWFNPSRRPGGNTSHPKVSISPGEYYDNKVFVMHDKLSGLLNTRERSGYSFDDIMQRFLYGYNNVPNNQKISEQRFAEIGVMRAQMNMTLNPTNNLESNDEVIPHRRGADTR